MFDFIKKIFPSSPKVPTYGTGLIGTLADSRNIPLGLVQSPVTIPESHVTDLSMLGVENQMSQPSCVGYAMSKLAEYYAYKQTGKVVKLSARALYAECKAQDGIPNAQGTYALTAAKILVSSGIPTDDQVKDDPTLNYPDYVNIGAIAFKDDQVATGYAFVDPSFDAITQAIYQNGIVSAGLFIDSNWFSGIIGKALAYIGGHQTNWHGYDKSNGKPIIFGMNQWGISWIGHIAGILDTRVKAGFYQANFADIQDAVINIIAFVPIPKAILDQVKNTGYHFITTMKLGMTSYEVLQMQKKLNIAPQTGYFGPLTEARVMQYQRDNNLAADGVVGAGTRAVLNVGTSALTVANVKEIIASVANQNGVEPELALAVAQCESSFNPLNTLQNKDKTGHVTSLDRGLYMWNSVYHAEVTDDMAFDPTVSCQLFCKAVKNGQLHANWSASEPNWKKIVPPAILKKYGIK